MGSKLHKGIIKEIKQVSKSLFYIEFEAKTVDEIKAGQFISILCQNLTLRRPFSVFSFKENKIGVLFKKKGEGTKYISNLKVGDEIDFTGPFGNGFTISDKKALLVGAGVGFAPVSYLKDNIKTPNLLIGGFVSKEEIPTNIKADLIATDDGSEGLKGYLINHLENVIDDFKPEIIYVCGPLIVLKQIAELSKKYNIKAELAFEKTMACGIGVCRGCTIKVKDFSNGGEEIKNKTVCKDGPVFDSKEIVW